MLDAGAGCRITFEYQLRSCRLLLPPASWLLSRLPPDYPSAVEFTKYLASSQFPFRSTTVNVSMPSAFRNLVR